MTNSQTLTVVPGESSLAGLYREELQKLGLKPGNWIGIRNQAANKTISRAVTEIRREIGWPQRLIFLDTGSYSKLGLFDKVNGTETTAPNSDANVEVWKLLLPHETKTYLSISTLAIALIAALGNVVSTPGYVKATLAILTAIVAFVSAISHKQ